MITAVLVIAVFLAIGCLLIRTLPREAPRIPADVMERIDATLPRSQARQRWLENQKDLRQ